MSCSPIKIHFRKPTIFNRFNLLQIWSRCIYKRRSKNASLKKAPSCLDSKSWTIKFSVLLKYDNIRKLWKVLKSRSGPRELWSEDYYLVRVEDTVGRFWSGKARGGGRNKAAAASSDVTVKERETVRYLYFLSRQPLTIAHLLSGKKNPSIFLIHFSIQFYWDKKNIYHF